MVKNHRHGSIGHNKHGSGGSSSAGSACVETLEEVAAKRPRGDKFSNAFAALNSLLVAENVTCSGTLGPITDGAEFSIAIEEPGTTTLHQSSYVRIKLSQNSLRYLLPLTLHFKSYSEH